MSRDATTPRILCVGSNLETEVVLRGLLDVGAHLVGLVTLPSDRGQCVCDYVDLHPLCDEARMATIDTVDINADETLHAIQARQPDYIYTLGWSQIFGDRLIGIPTQYVVGSHPTPLPFGRGRAPVPWTILEAHDQSAVSLFRMDAGVDSGPILCQKWFPIPPHAYAQDVYQAVAENLRLAFVEVYTAHRAGRELPAVIQTSSAASYRAKRTPADGHLDFHQPAEQVSRLIRAVSQPYPGAYTYYAGERVTVWECSLEQIPPYTGVTGQILLREQQRVLVQCGDQPIWLANFGSAGSEKPVRQFRVGRKFGFAVEDELFELKAEMDRLRERIQQLEAASAPETWRTT